MRTYWVTRNAVDKAAENKPIVFMLNIRIVLPDLWVCLMWSVDKLFLVRGACQCKALALYPSGIEAFLDHKNRILLTVLGQYPS
jgi:hypothetical protein